MSFFVYALQVSTFTILISQMFSTCMFLEVFLTNLKKYSLFKAFIAKVVTIILWILTAINFYDSLPSLSLKYIFCIFPNIGMTFVFQTIFQFERSNKRLGYLELYNNLFDDTQNLGAILGAMFGFTLLYIPIAWYIERILPGEYGVAYPLCFPFMVSFINLKIFLFQPIISSSRRTGEGLNKQNQ
jgi:hypothetical protein